MMTAATAIPGTLEVLGVTNFGEEFWLLVPCADYEAYRALPAGILFEGRTYGKTGWNSDTGRGFYCSARSFARVA